MVGVLIGEQIQLPWSNISEKGGLFTTKLSHLNCRNIKPNESIEIKS
jgi:hypothetical protein